MSSLSSGLIPLGTPTRQQPAASANHYSDNDDADDDDSYDDQFETENDTYEGDLNASNRGLDGFGTKTTNRSPAPKQQTSSNFNLSASTFGHHADDEDDNNDDSYEFEGVKQSTSLYGEAGMPGNVTPTKPATPTLSKLLQQSANSATSDNTESLPPTGALTESAFPNSTNTHGSTLIKSHQSIGAESILSSLSTISKNSKGNCTTADSWSDDDILDGLLSDNHTSHKQAKSLPKRDTGPGNAALGAHEDVDIEAKSSGDHESTIGSGVDAAEHAESTDQTMSAGDYVPSFLQTGQQRTGRRPRRVGVGASATAKAAAEGGDKDDDRLMQALFGGDDKSKMNNFAKKNATYSYSAYTATETPTAERDGRPLSSSSSSSSEYHPSTQQKPITTPKNPPSTQHESSSAQQNPLTTQLKSTTQQKPPTTQPKLLTTPAPVSTASAQTTNPTISNKPSTARSHDITQFTTEKKDGELLCLYSENAVDPTHQSVAFGQQQHQHQRGRREHTSNSGIVEANSSCISSNSVQEARLEKALEKHQRELKERETDHRKQLDALNEEIRKLRTDADLSRAKSSGQLEDAQHKQHNLDLDLAAERTKVQVLTDDLNRNRHVILDSERKFSMQHTTHATELERIRSEYERKIKDETERNEDRVRRLERELQSTVSCNHVAKTLQINAAKLDAMQDQLQQRNDNSEAARLAQLEAREKLVWELETSMRVTQQRVEEEYSRLQSLMLTLDTTQREAGQAHEAERIRLREEHARVEALQLTLRTESEVMRRDLTEERARFHEERRSGEQRLRTERADMETQRAELAGLQENVEKERREVELERKAGMKLAADDKARLWRLEESLHVKQVALVEDRANVESTRSMVERDAEDMAAKIRTLAHEKERQERETQRLNALQREVKQREDNFALQMAEATTNRTVAAETLLKAKELDRQASHARQVAEQESSTIMASRQQLHELRLQVARERKAMQEERVLREDAATLAQASTDPQKVPNAQTLAALLQQIEADTSSTNNNSGHSNNSNNSNNSDGSRAAFGFSSNLGSNFGSRSGGQPLEQKDTNSQMIQQILMDAQRTSNKARAQRSAITQDRQRRAESEARIRRQLSNQQHNQQQHHNNLNLRYSNTSTAYSSNTHHPLTPTHAHAHAHTHSARFSSTSAMRMPTTPISYRTHSTPHTTSYDTPRTMTTDGIGSTRQCMTGTRGDVTPMSLSQAFEESVLKFTNTTINTNENEERGSIDDDDIDLDDDSDSVMQEE